MVALVVIFFFLRKELLGPQPIPELDETVETGRRTKFTARLKTIDVGGQLLFIIGFGLIILALTWGGATYPWASAAVITPLVIGCIFAGSFVYWEFLLAPGNYLSEKMPWQRAMLPWALLSHRDIILLFYCECATGVGMYAVSLSKKPLVQTVADLVRCCTFATFTSLLLEYVCPKYLLALDLT